MTDNDESNEPPRKKSKIVYILAVIGILIVGGAVWSWYNASQELVPSLEVNIEIEGTISEPIIKSVEYLPEDVPKTDEPLKTRTHMPGIYIIAYGSRSPKGYLQPYTEWTSTDFHGKGTYNLKASFLFEPKHGENLRIQVKVINHEGKSIRKSSFEVKWGYEPVYDVSFGLTKFNDTYTFNDISGDQKWINPSDIATRKTEELPGIYCIIENENNLQLNYINSMSLSDSNIYTLRVYFQDHPKVWENVRVSFIVKDKDGNDIGFYPDNGDLTIQWTLSI
jgi:hypothetical protein